MEFFQTSGNFHYAKDSPKMRHSGTASNSAHRRNITAGIPSGPAEYDVFNFLAAVMTISGVISKTSKSTQLFGTFCIALSTDRVGTGSEAKTDEKNVANISHASASVDDLESSRNTSVGIAELFLFEFTKLQNFFGFLRKLAWVRRTYNL